MAAARIGKHFGCDVILNADKGRQKREGKTEERREDSIEKGRRKGGGRTEERGGAGKDRRKGREGRLLPRRRIEHKPLPDGMGWQCRTRAAAQDESGCE